MDFVTFEIAKKLKEKGFREKCFATYTPYSGTLKFNEINTDQRPTSYKLNIEEFRECYNYYEENNIDAPTISQVLKWLRNEKKIHLCIDIYDDGWFFDISSFYKQDSGVYEVELPYKSSNVTPDYETYEQAALAGIEYVLNNLI